MKCKKIVTITITFSSAQVEADWLTNSPKPLDIQFAIKKEFKKQPNDNSKRRIVLIHSESLSTEANELTFFK